MTYATRTNLEQRYGIDEVAQRESGLPAGAVAQALIDADVLIDGYLASRYSLPLTVVPSNLPQVACVIARYNLIGEAVSERARDDYRDALSWLKDVSAGRVKLPAATPVAGNEPAAIVLVNGGQQVFKRAVRP